MLRSLVRWKFVDRTWGQEDLEEIAKFWLRLYDEAVHPPHKSWDSHQTLELHLTGFTRSRAHEVSNQLSLRLGATGTPVDVSFEDPDTLIAKTKPREGNRQPFAGLGIPVLDGTPFDGLLVEIRFTVADAGTTEPAVGVVGATLVIVGELRAGTVVVKSVWRDPAFVKDESPWGTPSRWEEPLLQGFDKYRSRDKVSPTLASHLFNRPPRKRVWGPEAAFQRIRQWFVDTPFGRPRLGGLFRRCLTFGVFFPVVFVLAIVIFTQTQEAGWLVLLGLACLPVGYFACEFFNLEGYRMYTLRIQTREWYDEYYRRTTPIAPLAPNDARPWANDPLVRKFTAELLEAGFVHSGDIATVPTESANVVHRVFEAPDEVTYLTIGFMFAWGSGTSRACVWPVTTSVYCQTFDARGHRFETRNFEHQLVCLKREDPTARWLILPPDTHPLDLFTAHAKAAEVWSKESGAALLPHEQLIEYCAREEASRRQERKVYRAHPYSRRDHLRFYLQLDAKPSEKSK